MDFFIKKIFDEKQGKELDHLVHLQFQKFSKGEFKDKAMILARKSKEEYSLSTTPEYANELVRALAEKLGDKKTKVTGILVSTRDLTGELDFKDKKQFMGIKQYVIEKEMTGKEIVEMCDKYPNSFIGFSFNANENELKIKPKAPKSAKPSTKSDEKPKVDFCKLKTKDNSLVQNLLFDISESFKKVEIGHDFIITDIILPKNEKDIAKIREMAKRKGKIIRKINIDGKELRKEKEFIA